ncbi:SCO2400 family protein [Streptomyces gobitricini]|uniref:Zinc ribbon domain-containing protein n=1 Tax=Streptomyces gobitricini TaxID=68211 RepID=A0ABP5YAR5_9ACTN
MDYCHQCQRHLNGALACAGCGTPVEELRHDDPQTFAADHVYELDRDEELPPAGPRRARGQARRAQPSRRARPVGRRARKRRGRKLLVGAGALVLAAGLLSLAELAIEHPGEDGAATAVRQEDQAFPEPRPEQPEGSARPDDPSPVKEPVATATSTPDGPEDGSGAVEKGPGASSGAPGASASAPADGSATGPSDPRPSADPEEPGTPGAPDEDDPAPGDPPTEEPETPDNPGKPGETGSARPTPANPPPTEPTPAPTPTESCDWFLWWCV